MVVEISMLWEWILFTINKFSITDISEVMTS